MIPGVEKIFNALPKVVLTAKVKKVDFNTLRWNIRQGDYRQILHYLDEQREGEIFLPIFRVFLKDYTDEEIIKGAMLAYQRSSNLKYDRTFNTPAPKDRRIGVTVPKSKVTKFKSKLNSIKLSRQIPNFNNTTQGILAWHPVTFLEEKNAFEDGRVLTSLPTNKIHVFPFKDKNGKVFLNFYGAGRNSYNNPGRRKRRAY